jgi:UrcA family protein
MSKLFKASIVIVVGLSVSGCTRFWNARPDDPTRERVRVEVQHNDLDVTTEAGARTLLQRITDASIEACGGKPGRGMEERDNFRACVRQTKKGAVTDLNIPALTKLHESEPD